MVLRECLVERLPGLYVPPIPGKKVVGNKSQSFVEGRCFLLNMFFKQLSRCPWLLESDEYNIFVQPESGDPTCLQRELTLLPHISH